MSNVKRVYVEKKSGFDVQAKELKTEIRSYLGIKDVDSVRVLIVTMWKMYLMRHLRKHVMASFLNHL